jgi:hypothetical protein
MRLPVGIAPTAGEVESNHRVFRHQYGRSGAGERYSTGWRAGQLRRVAVLTFPSPLPPVVCCIALEEFAIGGKSGRASVGDSGRPCLSWPTLPVVLSGRSTEDARQTRAASPTLTRLLKGFVKICGAIQFSGERRFAPIASPAGTSHDQERGNVPPDALRQDDLSGRLLRHVPNRTWSPVDFTGRPNADWCAADDLVLARETCLAAQAAGCLPLPTKCTGCALQL